MPQVTMPDGTTVDMPDQITPEQGRRLRELVESQKNDGFRTLPGAQLPTKPAVTPDTTHERDRPPHAPHTKIGRAHV